jgi:hypothetical protein
MDRLLSEQEICDTCPSVAMRTWEQDNLRCCPADCLVHPDLTRAAAAQLAKADKEWVEWLDETCKEHSHTRYYITRRECILCWQERKKEIGL